MWLVLLVLLLIGSLLLIGVNSNLSNEVLIAVNEFLILLLLLGSFFWYRWINVGQNRKILQGAYFLILILFSINYLMGAYSILLMVYLYGLLNYFSMFKIAKVLSPEWKIVDKIKLRKYVFHYNFWLFLAIIIDKVSRMV